MVQFKELKKDAQRTAAEFFAYKLGYKLVGNPYVQSVAQEVDDYCKAANKTFFFDDNGRFICAQAIEEA